MQIVTEHQRPQGQDMIFFMKYLTRFVSNYLVNISHSLGPSFPEDQSLALFQVLRMLDKPVWTVNKSFDINFLGFLVSWKCNLKRTWALSPVLKHSLLILKRGEWKRFWGHICQNIKTNSGAEWKRVKPYDRSCLSYGTTMNHSLSEKRGERKSDIQVDNKLKCRLKECANKGYVSTMSTLQKAKSLKLGIRS